jgi:hypothetical protein
MGDASDSDSDSGTDANTRVNYSKVNKNYKIGDNLDELRKNGSLARMIQGAPAYDSKDPVMWRRNMLSYASSYFDLNDILKNVQNELLTKSKGIISLEILFGLSGSMLLTKWCQVR